MTQHTPLHISNDYILESDVNVSFATLFTMTEEEYDDWLVALARVIKSSWEERGEPPVSCGNESAIAKDFLKLSNTDEVVKVLVNESTGEKNCLHSKLHISAANYFFANRATSQDLNDSGGTSLHKVWVLEPESKNTKKILNGLKRQVKNDSFFKFAPKVREGDRFSQGITDGYEWIKKYISQPIPNTGIFFENWDSHISRTAGRALKISSGYFKKLISDGFVEEHHYKNRNPKSVDLRQPILIRIYDTNTRIFPNSFELLSKGVGMGGNFPSAIAKHLYQTYTKPSLETQIIYDSSSGYGGRLVGALSLNRDRHIHYVGTDPNPDHFLDEYGITRYEYLAEFFHSVVRNQYQTTTDIFTLGSEEIHKDRNFQKYKGKVDFIFTSPPYFFAEGYSDDENQSYKKFPTYDEWRDGFLKRTLQTCVEWLREDRHLCWNIADIAHKGVHYPLEYDSRKILTDLGMEYQGNYQMLLSGGVSNQQVKNWTRLPSTKNFATINGSFRKTESIFVFYKPKK